MRVIKFENFTVNKRMSGLSSHVMTSFDDFLLNRYKNYKILTSDQQSDISRLFVPYDAISDTPFVFIGDADNVILRTHVITS